MQFALPDAFNNQESFSKDGLSITDAEGRLKIYGANELEVEEKRKLSFIRKTMQDPMIWFLLFVSILFFFSGSQTESFILLAAIIPIAGMDAFLHRRTQTSIDKLKKKLPRKIKVKRSKKLTEISTEKLVPGDLVIIEAGSYVPADGLIIDGDQVLIDESPLTGESLPQRKSSFLIEDLEVNKGKHVIDTKHWAFAGCHVLKGSMSLRVIYTGKTSLYGQIILATRSIKQSKTPLQEWTTHLVLGIFIGALVLSITLASVRLYQGFGLLDATINASMLAIAAIPEEFPMVLTLFLAFGIYQLSQKKALIRTSATVENMAHVDILCTDKTGTMTEGLLRLSGHYPSLKKYENSFFEYMALSRTDDEFDPIEKALREHDAGQCTKKRLDILPFQENLKFSAVRYQDESDHVLEVFKGAHETILEKSDLSSEKRLSLLQQANDLSKAGVKVIGLAIKRKSKKSIDNWSTKPEFIGFMTFEDRLKKYVKSAVEKCHDMGIHVMMITGDHPETAKYIAVQAGLADNNHIRVLNADHVDSHSWLQHFTTSQIHVIARALPSQKLEIVASLQKLGNCVAVTGDGINDIPALKKADVSITMGLKGTEAARNTGSIVLLDDKFSTIVDAITIGRRVFQNIRHSFSYLIIIHIPFILLACLIPLWGYPKLFEPVHIVLIETMIHPTAVLGFLHPQKNNTIIETKRRKMSKSLFKRNELIRIFSIGVFASVISIYAYHTAIMQQPMNPRHASTLVLSILLALNSAMILNFKRSLHPKDQKLNIAIITVYVLLLNHSQSRQIASLSSLSIHEVAGLISLSLLFLLVIRLTIPKRMHEKL